MKKTSKIISIILSIFMLMQVMAGAVFANSDVPENLRWITGREVGRNSDEQGWIAWDLVDGCNAYVLFAYKDNEPVETMLIEVDEEYDFGYESINGCMKANGTGSYTVKAAAYNGKWEDFDKYEYDEDIPILGESEMSEAFEYVGEASSNKDDSTKGTVTAPTAKGDGDSAAADNTKSEESTKPADGKTPTVAEGEIECPLAVKVCYDLGIMPNVYENANKFVTYNDFSKVTSELFGSKPRGESNENIKLESVFDTFASGMVGYKSSIETKYFTGINDGVKLDEDAQITHAQLAKVVYNALNGMIKIAEGKIVKDYNGQLVPESEENVKAGMLFNKGYVKYIGDVTVSGDKAIVNGKLYNRENKNGTDAKDVALNISDKDLKSGSDYLLFVKDDTIISAVSNTDIKAEEVIKNFTPPTVITLKIGDVNATLNGENVVNDVAPTVVNDRTMLPIRFIAESLGANVGWYERTKTVSITSKSRDISVIIGDKKATVIEKEGATDTTKDVELDSPAFVESGRTYLPLRFVTENLGADVKWDGETKTVTITK